jgi:hypothetical protein
MGNPKSGCSNFREYIKRGGIIPPAMANNFVLPQWNRAQRGLAYLS